MARTRTNVLATLYQNYLRELQASQPRKVGTPPPARRGTPTARRKASSGYHYRRTALPTRKSAHVSQTGHSSRGDGGGGSSEEEEREQRDSPTTSECLVVGVWLIETEPDVLLFDVWLVS